jgi:hypothetical protein
VDGSTQRRRVRRVGLAVVLAGAILASALVAGCGLLPGGHAGTPAPLFGAGYPVYHDAATGIRTILGTPDLAVGSRRVAFVMSDPANGVIRASGVAVDSFFYPDGAGGTREGPIERSAATFYAFPYGSRGIDVARIAFDRAGTWGLDVHVPRPDGTTATVTFTFPVAQHTKALDVGDPAPTSRNRTLADVASAAQLTTSATPNPALYQVSIAGALAAHRPFVVVFTSPAFCTNELCGPEVDVLGELQAQYGDRADFIHVDLYTNPDQIQGDLTRAVRNPILKQWRVPTDEWTFIVGADGRIAARFESFATAAEIRAALLPVLGP